MSLIVSLSLFSTIVVWIGVGRMCGYYGMWSQPALCYPQVVGAWSAYIAISQPISSFKSDVMLSSIAPPKVALLYSKYLIFWKA